MAEKSSHKEPIEIEFLSEHPLNAKFYQAQTAEQAESLKASLKEYGQRTLITVCGEGCASPPGTLLGGHRRARAAAELGWQHLDGEVWNNLSAEDEERLLLTDNLAAHEHRTLSQRERYMHEKRLRELSGRKQGARHDLDPSKVTGSTDSIVGAELHASASEVRQRRKIFDSKILVPNLEQALEDGTLSLTRGAELVRRLERELQLGQVSMYEVHNKMEALVEQECRAIKERGGPGRRGKRQKNDDREPMQSDGRVSSAPKTRSAGATLSPAERMFAAAHDKASTRERHPAVLHEEPANFSEPEAEMMVAIHQVQTAMARAVPVLIRGLLPRMGATDMAVWSSEETSRRVSLLSLMLERLATKNDFIRECEQALVRSFE